MHRLQRLVNVIPIVAKADTLTVDELSFFKQQVNSNKSLTW